MFLKKAVLALQALLAASVLAGAAIAGPVVNSGHIESELVAQEAGIAPGGTVYVALRQKIIPGWHTYWRNPGDAGEATRIAWTLPAGWSAGDMVWPTPKKAKLGPLLDYAYEGEVLIPVPITAPADAQVGTTISLNAAVSYLVCEQVCVPEDVKLTLLLPVVGGAPAADPKWGAVVGRVLADAPKPAGLKAVFKFDGQALKLAVTGGPLKGADLAGAYFFPYSPKVIEHAADQAIERGPEGVTLTLKPGYDFVGGGTAPAELAGVLSTKGGAWEVTATAGEPPATAAGLGAPPAEAAPPAGMTGGLVGALLFAFVGGLILNLMPCVFPVLSMKAASLAGHAHDAGKTRLQGLVFLLGVVATFLALAGLLLAVRAGGAAVGWGFQLQSPLVVAGLALLMLLVALNMSGVFEIGTSVQNVGSGASAKGGATGAFFTGALAVVVAAPCTAPFMAGALGYALTQPTLVSLAVFLALALGFAAPFVAVAFIPGLLKLLPRPGAWMDVLKKGLAFPMYGAALWLVWVFAQQSGPLSLAHLLAAGVLAAFGAWLYGLAQARRAVGEPALVSLLIALAALGLAVTVAIFGALAAHPPTDAVTASAETPSGPGLTAEAWSPERVKALQAEGRPILVDFTAAWCVTCQVNEKVALSGAKVAEAFKARNAVYMKADWTNRDPVIAKALAEFGRVGVPLYVVYPKNGGAPVILPQLLTEGLVIEAIEKAGA
ncbi:thioredoxin family protein [Caulobacter sp. 1776]|uniref:protein-disulfide reductase DsbD family protein n=1 Tax=Caulobacter sp. 1776 TaxID=3156420 RepID=UPI003391B46A